MTALDDRRGFLRGLVSLPLIGGGVTLIGRPTAVAQPVTRDLLTSYWNWLFFERRLLCREMASTAEEYRWLQDTYGGHDPLGKAKAEDATAYYPEFHFPRFGNWTEVPEPSTRAALVMGAVDFDWQPVPR